MKTKFQIRPYFSLFDGQIPAGWAVIAPSGQSEEFPHFHRAVKGMDAWIEDRRLRLVADEKVANHEKESLIARA